MAFNVADFKAQVAGASGGLQKPNKFRVRVFVPTALGFGGGGGTARNLEFWAESVVLPMYMISGGIGQRFGYGTPEYRPTIPVFDTVSLTLIADAEGSNHALFTSWLNLIATADDIGGGGALFEIGYRQDVVSEVEIDMFAETGQLSMSIRLQEALPVAIGNVKLDWADNTNYMRIPIEFRYWKWSRIQGTITNTPTSTIGFPYTSEV